MEYFAAPLQNLIEEFEKLPGIGSKTCLLYTSESGNNYP